LILLLFRTSQPGPGSARKKFNEFFVKQYFFCSDLLMFCSLGYPGVRGSGWWGHACVKNLSWVGVEVCAKFGRDWFGGSSVKEGHIYSLFYIHSLNFKWIKNDKKNHAWKENSRKRCRKLFRRDTHCLLFVSDECFRTCQTVLQVPWDWPKRMWVVWNYWILCPCKNVLIFYQRMVQDSLEENYFHLIVFLKKLGQVCKDAKKKAS